MKLMILFAASWQSCEPTWPSSAPPPSSTQSDLHILSQQSRAKSFGSAIACVHDTREIFSLCTSPCHEVIRSIVATPPILWRSIVLSAHLSMCLFASSFSISTLLNGPPSVDGTEVPIDARCDGPASMALCRTLTSLSNSCEASVSHVKHQFECRIHVKLASVLSNSCEASISLNVEFM
jgi:hypothetical protein